MAAASAAAGLADEHDDDPIVDSIEVVLTGPVSETLRVVMAPQRPVGVPYGEANHEHLLRASYKPQADIMEFAYRVDLPNTRRNDDHVTLAEPGSFPCVTVRSEAMPPRTNYMLGVMHEGRLHMTPVARFAQLRPDFSAYEAARRAAAVAEQQATAKGATKHIKLDDDDDGEDDELDRMTVSVSRRESEIARAKREASYSHMQRRFAEEPWRELDVVTDSALARARLDELLVLRPPDGGTLPLSSTFDVSPAQYLDMLTPPVPHKEDSTTRAPSFSLEGLMRVPLRARFTMLLNRAHVLSMPECRTYLLHGEEPAAVEELESLAHLVRGSWVARSSLGQVIDPELAPLRNLIVCFFAKDRRVSPQHVHKLSGHRLTVVKDVMRPLMTTVATQESGIEFRNRDDLDWIPPALRERAESQLQALERQALDALQPARGSKPAGPGSAEMVQ